MLTVKETLRYSRQIMLPKIGEAGQLRLTHSKVLIIGLGGLGNPTALYLAAAGVGSLLLIDGDTIEVSNLPRQILFNDDDIGLSKVAVAAQKIARNNPDIVVEEIDEMLDQSLADYYIPQVDVVIDCSDNFATRQLINRHCIEHQVPLIIASATGFDGQLLMVDSNIENSACYHCLYPEQDKEPAQNCQTLGILGPVLAIIAGMACLQAIKQLSGLPMQLNQLSLFDGLSNQWQQFSFKKQPQCPVCG